MSGAIDHAGWAFKQGSKVKNWKKRYFVLRGRELSYFASQNIYGRAEDEKGRVTVAGVEMVAGDAKSREELLLITCERKSQLLKLKPPTPEDARAWLRKLQLAVAPPNHSSNAPGTMLREREASVNATNLFGTDIHDEQDDGDATAYGYGQPQAPAESVQAYYQNAQTTESMRPSMEKADSYSHGGRRLAESALAMDTELESDDNQHDSDLDDQDAYYEASRGVPRGSLAQGNHIGVTQEGWVTVGEPHDQRSWKKRYGVLAGPTFTYYASKGGEAIDTVWINAVALSRVRPNTVDLKLESGRVLGLAVDTREDLIEWERSIAAVLGTPVLLRATSSRVDAFDSGDDDGGRPSSYTGVYREGWLQIKQGFSKSDWKRRFFVLNGAMLLERETPTSTAMSESIVVGVEVRNDVEIEVELMSGRMLWLKAENTADTEAWIHALSDLVGTPSALEPKQLVAPVIRPMIQNVAPFQPKAQPAPPPPTEKRGWLMKEGGLIKSWKRRFFVLEGDTLHYFDKTNGVVLGGGIVSRVERNTVTANSLNVHFLNGRLLRISSETRADIDAWFEILTRAADLSTRITSPPSESSIAPQLGRDNSQEGWLLKRGQRLKNWKRRYFVIQRNRLMYYDTMNGDLLGSGTVFDVAEGNQRPLCLDVRFQNGRLLHVVAADDADFIKWHDALKNASNISETVLSQRSFTQEELPFEKDFDYDMNDEGGVAGDGDDLEFEEFDDLDNGDRGSTGFGEWDAAMRNKPDLSHQDSWDSDASESNNDDAADYNSDGASSVSRGIRKQGSDTSVTEERRGCSGWLRKEGGHIKTWKRRYFTLHGTTLKYFKSASGSLIRSLEVTHVEETSSPKFGIAITVAGGRRLVVAAESNDEYEKWLLTLWGVLADQRASLAEGVEPRYSALGVVSVKSVPTSPMAGSAGSGPTYPAKSGWLEKEGQVFKTWKKRYFTLKQGALMYFSDVGGEAQGHGTVKGVIVDSTKPNTLRILMGKDRVMRVTAANAADSTAWFQALTASIKTPHGSEASSDDYSEAGSNAERRPMGSAPSSPAETSTKEPTPQQTRASRFSADDYLKNDTITNESFLRIRGGGDDLALTGGSFYKPRSFKGELPFEAKLPTPQETEDGSSGLIRIDSEDDLEYLKGSNVDQQKMDAQRRKKEREEQLPKGCAPCCIVM